MKIGHHLKCNTSTVLYYFDLKEEFAVPKFLMFDHGGVLDGDFVASKTTIAKNDLVLMEHKEGGFQVLKNGVAIVNAMNNLVQYHGYEVVFHSKNREEDQFILLKQLQEACKKIGLKFPAVKAMAVYDSSSYKNISSSSAIMTISQGIIVAGWAADDLDGKASVRRALERVLDIGKKDYGQHVVFDDVDSIIEEAKKEGYQAFSIGIEKGQVTLNTALQQVLLSQPVRDTDIEFSVVEGLCNDFLGIDVKAPATPMKISLNNHKDQPDKVSLIMSFDVTIVRKYLPQLDKLKYILEKLGLSQVEKENTNWDCGILNVPCCEIVKLSPLCTRRYSDNLEEDNDSKLRKVQVLCARYLGHTWEVRQNGSQPIRQRT